MEAIDAGLILDDSRWSGYQKLLVVGTALAIILDGIDTQLLGNALPSLIRAWALPRSAFTTALALGPLGMMAGGAIGGVAGDRVGRRTALLGSVIAFAALTLATAAVETVPMLGLLRFLAGLGLGGALPNAAALASEYAPRRQRAFAVTLTIVCFPLGGTVAALLAAQVLPAYGWRALFVAGGAIPIVIAAILLAALPESPRFLASRRERWPELAALLRRLGHDVAADATFVDAGSGRDGRRRGSAADLFAPALRRDTLGLFGAFFFGLMANNMGILLIPAMLTAAGFTQAVASNALAAWNFGGVGGAIVGALVIERIGSRITMLGLSGLAVASAAAMASAPPDPRHTVQMIVLFVLLGGTLNAVITTMYALAANVYPTGIRGTGIGTAVSLGRLGMVLASYVGSFALDAGGAPAYFWTFAVSLALVFGLLALVRRHIGVAPGPAIPAPLGAKAGN
jgi:MFS transporter, AAHS family, 4-hydroxybenzoate transporter